MVKPIDLVGNNVYDYIINKNKAKTNRKAGSDNEAVIN
jgi:hypothetical protein